MPDFADASPSLDFFIPNGVILNIRLLLTPDNPVLPPLQGLTFF